MGLGATLTIFEPNTLIKSDEANTNFAAINNTGNPQFTTLTVTSTSSLQGTVAVGGAATFSNTATFNGAATFASTTPTSFAAGSGNTGVELGALARSESPYLDFHSSGQSRDYDSRLQASGGSAAGDGLGGLTLYGQLGLTLNNGPLVWNGTMGGVDQIVWDVHPSDNATRYQWVRGNDSTLSLVHANSGNRLAQFDASGNLTLRGDVKLAAGLQETDRFDLFAESSTFHSSFGFRQAFRRPMTNIPSNIQFSIDASIRIDGAATSVSRISETGFTLLVFSSATGHMNYEGTYTTQGNCLLAVDEALRTFDHHCDGCERREREEHGCNPGRPCARCRRRAIKRGLSLDRDLQLTGAGALNDSTIPVRVGNYGLCYVCPVCSTIEHYAPNLETVHESEVPEATLVRQAQRVLGLPMLP
jgi:hypothetical protein